MSGGNVVQCSGVNQGVNALCLWGKKGKNPLYLYKQKWSMMLQFESSSALNSLKSVVMACASEILSEASKLVFACHVFPKDKRLLLRMNTEKMARDFFSQIPASLQRLGEILTNRWEKAPLNFEGSTGQRLLAIYRRKNQSLPEFITLEQIIDNLEVVVVARSFALEEKLFPNRMVIDAIPIQSSHAFTFCLTGRAEEISFLIQKMGTALKLLEPQSHQQEAKL